MRKLQLVALLAVMVLLLAACGGGNTTSSGSGNTEGTTGGAESAVPAPKSVTVEGTNDLKYLPAELTAEAGQSLDITLQNSSALEHN
ncbi:MAG: auracyanin, partial [Ardenticatenales bacterium]|nr:auracyanin [Ardenticatenales bacterium]